MGRLSWRALLFATTAAVVLGISGCTSATPEDTAIELASVDSLIADFDCKTVEILEDDVYFHDSMRGMNCVYSDQSAILLRVYAEAESVRQVLPDWAPTLSEANQLLQGRNWFAVGTPKLLEQFGQTLGVTAELTSRYTAEPAPVSTSEQAVGACSSFIVGEVRNALDGKELPTTGAEEVYPGIDEEIDAAVTELQDAHTDADNFEQNVSALGSKFKQYCYSWEEQNDVK